MFSQIIAGLLILGHIYDIPYIIEIYVFLYLRAEVI